MDLVNGLIWSNRNILYDNTSFYKIRLLLLVSILNCTEGRKFVNEEERSLSHALPATRTDGPIDPETVGVSGESIWVSWRF